MSRGTRLHANETLRQLGQNNNQIFAFHGPLKHDATVCGDTVRLEDVLARSMPNVTTAAFAVDLLMDGAPSMNLFDDDIMTQQMPRLAPSTPSP